MADPEWKSLILFGVYTGQRLGDLAVLTWDNVDLVRSEIRFRTRKTGKQMILPIAPPLRVHLENLSIGDKPGSALHPKAFAIMQRQGRSGNLSNQFSDLLAQAGLREKAPHRSKGKGRDGLRASNALTFHSLRHTAVSLLKDAGIPEAVVMELVGHDSKEMSKHYTHVGHEALERAAAALPVWENTATGEHAIWYYQRGVFLYRVTLPTLPTQWHIAAVADILGDDKDAPLFDDANTGAHGRIYYAHSPDLIWENTVTGQHAIWILSAQPNVGYVAPPSDNLYGIPLPTIPTQWHIAGAADFTGSGQAGLVWENAVTGQRSIWVLKDGVPQSYIPLPTTITQWHSAEH